MIKENEAEQKWAFIEFERQKEYEKSLEEARKLQAFEDEEARKRAEIIDQQNMPDCSICLEKIQGKDLLPLDICGHLYHPACMKEHLKIEIEARHFPLVCPNPNCKLELSMLDIKDFLDPVLRSKWEEYTLQKCAETHPEDFSYCPTADCPYIFIWEAGKDTNDYTCPQCKKHYCLNCRCIYHDDQTCQEYQINAKFTVFLIFTIKN